jgi:coenzyme F420-dependent glucose-6-phosphate dehydrogenase
MPSTVVSLGYSLSSEEHPPRDLVRHARMAEEHGFEYGLISDHFHPWTRRQGQSPFAWGVLGAIAQATERFRIGTGVTAPIIRIHPVVVAQAAATAAALMPGRFFLGVGTGERLNEHVLGDKWPPIQTRQQMLEEAVEIIRLLWSGDECSYDGRHYTVENARLYTLPDEPIPLYVAASGPESARLAGQIGDGLISTAPQREVVDAFAEGGGAPDAPRYGQLTVCWARDDATARRTALEWWPNAAVHGELSVELALPVHFEQASQDVTEEQVAQSIVCGPDPEPHVARIRAFAEAGFDHVYVHQVGPDQEGMLEFYAREILPALQREGLGAAADGR